MVRTKAGRPKPLQDRIPDKSHAVKPEFDAILCCRTRDDGSREIQVEWKHPGKDPEWILFEDLDPEIQAIALSKFDLDNQPMNEQLDKGLPENIMVDDDNADQDFVVPSQDQLPSSSQRITRSTRSTRSPDPVAKNTPGKRRGSNGRQKKESSSGVLFNDCDAPPEQVYNPFGDKWIPAPKTQSKRKKPRPKKKAGRGGGRPKKTGNHSPEVQPEASMEISSVNDGQDTRESSEDNVPVVNFEIQVDDANNFVLINTVSSENEEEAEENPSVPVEDVKEDLLQLQDFKIVIPFRQLSDTKRKELEAVEPKMNVPAHSSLPSPSTLTVIRPPSLHPRSRSGQNKSFREDLEESIKEVKAAKEPKKRKKKRVIESDSDEESDYNQAQEEQEDVAEEVYLEKVKIKPQRRRRRHSSATMTKTVIEEVDDEVDLKPQVELPVEQKTVDGLDIIPLNKKTVQAKPIAITTLKQDGLSSETKSAVCRLSTPASFSAKKKNALSVNLLELKHQLLQARKVNNDSPDPSKTETVTIESQQKYFIPTKSSRSQTVSASSSRNSLTPIRSAKRRSGDRDSSVTSQHPKNTLVQLKTFTGFKIPKKKASDNTSGPGDEVDEWTDSLSSNPVLDVKSQQKASDQMHTPMPKRRDPYDALLLRRRQPFSSTPKVTNNSQWTRSENKATDAWGPTSTENKRDSVETDDWGPCPSVPASTTTAANDDWADESPAQTKRPPTPVLTEDATVKPKDPETNLQDDWGDDSSGKKNVSKDNDSHPWDVAAGETNGASGGGGDNNLNSICEADASGISSSVNSAKDKNVASNETEAVDDGWNDVLVKPSSSGNGTKSVAEDNGWDDEPSVSSKQDTAPSVNIFDPWDETPAPNTCDSSSGDVSWSMNPARNAFMVRAAAQTRDSPGFIPEVPFEDTVVKPKRREDEASLLSCEVLEEDDADLVWT